LRVQNHEDESSFYTISNEDEEVSVGCNRTEGEEEEAKESSDDNTEAYLSAGEEEENRSRKISFESNGME